MCGALLVSFVRCHGGVDLASYDVMFQGTLD
jgi:hypothetical protein